MKKTASMPARTEVTPELSRELTFFHITMMSLGMMIGAGVFLGVGNSIAVAGPGGVILTFALNGVLAMLTALSYAELSSAIPRAGGAYNFARIGLGRGAGFLSGWIQWFASAIAGSVYALTFSIYGIRYLETLGLWGWTRGIPNVSVKVLSVAIALFFIYINYRGASSTGKVGAFFTLGQTVFLAFIGVVGFIVVIFEPERLANFQPFLPNGWSRLLATMGFTYVAFEGFEVIAQAGDETVNPRKNLPKAMLVSVFIVMLLYIGVAFATVVSVKAGSPGVENTPPWEWIGGFRERGFGEAISRLMPMANLLLTLAVIFASTSALNATIFSATRASYALGRDRMLPQSVASISRKHKTPWVALSLTGLIVILIATVLPTMDVASSASMMFLILFLLVNVCVIKIRRSMEDELTYGFKMPWFPLLPILAILCQCLLSVWMLKMSVVAWIVAPAWIACGILIYIFYSKSRVLPIEDEIVVFEDKVEPMGDHFRVMIPIANPENAMNLVTTAFKVCEAKQAAVELLHMVAVPEQVPLSDADDYMREGKEGILEAMLYLAPKFSVGTTVRYCRNVARGIVSAIREKKIEMLILGWHGPRAQSDFVLGSTLDSVIERSPCNVVIVKDSSDQKYRKILVPVGGGPYSAFALEIAGILSDNQVGEITAFAVDTGSPFHFLQYVTDAREHGWLPPDRIRMKVVQSRDVAGSILRESEEGGYDLVVIGATRQPLLHQIAKIPVPYRVARSCRKPLVIVKASDGVRSWIRRWI
jgi:amino acid transporter/nucleotide-binding universal stress UspA family protein